MLRSVVSRVQKARFFSSKENAAVILSASRTPIGAFRGALASVPASQLGAIAIKATVAKAGLKPEEVEQVIMGNVLAAGQGQAPARQAAIKAGLPPSVVCTTINKVCSSGMKSVMYAASDILLGQHQVVVAGGMESMSNVPYYMTQARGGFGYGHGKVEDGILKDGLWDAFDDHHMGNCAESTAKKFNISRADQDQYCIGTYKRAAEAVQNGSFKAELVGVPITTKKGQPPVMITEDEEVKKVNYDKIPTLKPAFIADGTVTAANASKLNDGAAALLLSSSAFAASRGLKPLARVLGFADAEQLPIDFPTAPALAIPLALKRAGLSVNDIDLFEINEAFSVVALANIKMLNLDASKVNIYGGAVALGHPIGCSGARIVTTLVHALQQRNGRYGVAAICNGGGGASAIVVERLQ
eukprot:TRINITY_DN599_c0_g1_i2.p1 TRINITY_DN599_c0_g1~~TRINITY_DN599_c0_g1_i2.p1  ORF type:complete len:413 (+),score=216.70 TRINITY_DN599_c0_g1_i2:61-1299(+)